MPTRRATTLPNHALRSASAGFIARMTGSVMRMRFAMSRAASAISISRSTVPLVSKFATTATVLIVTPMQRVVLVLFLAQIARMIRTAPMVIYAWSFIRIA